MDCVVVGLGALNFKMASESDSLDHNIALVVFRGIHRKKKRRVVTALN